MKYIKMILLVTFSVLSVYANEFYGVVQPINVYNVKASVSGIVLNTREDLEAKSIKNQTIIRLDSKVDKIDLEQTKQKLENLQKIYQLEKGTLESFNKVSSKSKFDKDNQKIKILNIKSTINDIKIKIATLKDKINKKTIIINNLYLFDIAVKKGDYINPGALLYTAYDIRKSKIEVFLPIDEVNKYKHKMVYINGNKTNYKINKIYKIADNKHISAYKCEIILDSIYPFSKVLKVTFK